MKNPPFGQNPAFLNYILFSGSLSTMPPFCRKIYSLRNYAGFLPACPRRYTVLPADSPIKFTIPQHRPNEKKKINLFSSLQKSLSLYYNNIYPRNKTDFKRPCQRCSFQKRAKKRKTTDLLLIPWIAALMKNLKNFVLRQFFPKITQQSNFVSVKVDLKTS